MKIAIARVLTLLLTAALAAVVVYWIAQSERESKLLLYLIAIVPLLPWIRGLLHGTPKAHMSLAVVSLLYLLHGSVEAFTTGSLLGWIESAIALALMFSASMYARWSRLQD
jgi:uncharacterized membrane protein